VRKSDYIGDFIFADPYGPDGLNENLRVDKAVLDPVGVTPGDGDDATLPVIHAHSDFWPDPQVALLTESLLKSVIHQPGAQPGPQIEAAPAPREIETAAAPATAAAARNWLIRLTGWVPPFPAPGVRRRERAGER
jgi:hypothetical protein